jgi:hypothetical protein
VTLQLDQNVTANVKLGVASAGQVVQVQAAAPLINAQTPTPGCTFLAQPAGFGTLRRNALTDQVLRIRMCPWKKQQGLLKARRWSCA